jgi:hypothetical protein
MHHLTLNLAQYEKPVFDRHIAGGRLAAYFACTGFVVFTSISVPISTSWWIVPGTHVEEAPR